MEKVVKTLKLWKMREKAKQNKDDEKKNLYRPGVVSRAVRREN